MVRATRSSAAKVLPPAVKEEPVQLSSPPATPVPRNARKRKTVKREESNEDSVPARALATPKSTKRAKKSAVKEEDVDDLPHGLGGTPDAPVKPSPPKETSQPKKKTRAKKEDINDLVEKATIAADTSSKKTKAKNSGYGLTPGQTPYPNYPHPTAEECEEVTRLLEKVHGKVEAPKTIPMPSLEVSGCGEVPSVLDALIRTRLSAATSGTNSSRAFAGLVARFGVLKEGIGKGSVDWNAVRLADTKEIFTAIKSGGLADVKSKDIKKILQMVWEENQARRHALASPNKNAASPCHESQADQADEMEKANNDIISLDHLHLLSTDDAFTHLTRYPGIGPKTASCVLLFCLQRPSFAVDTHVFRLCKWLAWVPAPGDPTALAPNSKPTAPFPGPTRNSTYAHCEVRVPDHLKYPLHQLLIRHGKSCPRCRAITGERSAGWHQGCPIEHLVQRTGLRKGNAAGTANAKRNKKMEMKMLSDEESDAVGSESHVGTSELSELSELASSDDGVEVEDTEDEISE